MSLAPEKPVRVQYPDPKVARRKSWLILDSYENEEKARAAVERLFRRQPSIEVAQIQRWDPRSTCFKVTSRVRPKNSQSPKRRTRR